MSEKHTPGRLGAFIVYAEPELRDDAGNLVAVIHHHSSANARRLVACWNACEGFSTEALEQYTTLAGIIRQRDSVIAECDELLMALTGLLSYFESGNSVPVDKATIKADSVEVRAALAAVAKVKGGAG